MLLDFSADGEVAGSSADGDKKKDKAADKVKYSQHTVCMPHMYAQMHRKSLLSFVMTGQERP